MPYNYFVYKRIFTESRKRMPDFNPTSVLDYGAGLGSGAWAAHHVFPDKVERVAAVEPNVNMRKLGKYMTTEQFKSEILWVDSLAMIPSGERGKFDLIVLGYVLQEVSTAQSRQLIVDALW